MYKHGKALNENTHCRLRRAGCALTEGWPQWPQECVARVSGCITYRACVSRLLGYITRSCARALASPEHVRRGHSLNLVRHRTNPGIRPGCDPKTSNALPSPTGRCMGGKPAVLCGRLLPYVVRTTGCGAIVRAEAERQWANSRLVTAVLCPVTMALSMRSGSLSTVGSCCEAAPVKQGGREGACNSLAAAYRWSE